MFVMCRINVANNHTLLSSLSPVGPDDLLFKLFKKALSAIHRIYDFFDESFAEGVLHPYVAHVVGELDGVLAETWFISPVKHNAFPAALSPDTYDPKNVLADLVVGGKFIFTDDNIISFFEVTSDSDEYAAISFGDVYSSNILLHGSKLHKTIARPSIFRRGHLVEAGLGFRTTTVGASQVFLTRFDSIMLVSRIGSQVGSHLYSSI
jgi:hypothetical protein